MKLKNITYSFLILSLFLSIAISCKKEATVNIATYGAFTQPTATSPVVRADGTVLFSGSTVTLTWASQNQNSDAVSWTVYFGTDKKPAVYKTGLTAQTLAVPVVDGKTYYWKVEITDGRGIKTTSETYSFVAVSGLNPAINMDLTCTTNVLSAVGVDLAADKVIDLRLLILKQSDMSVVKTIDAGAANESYADFGTLADGTYVVGVDIYSTLNFGDINKTLNLSLALQFNQLGMINKKLDFPDVMTNANPCSLYRTYLATVKKAGAVYTITSAISYAKPPVLTWKGLDATYTSQVTTTESCTSKTMKGLGFGWMLDWWGEVITSGGTLTYTVSGNTITIPLQKYCKTTYNGAAQPEYSIQGSGTIDNSGATPVWKIKYDFIQSGASIGTISNQYGWPTKYFEATINL